ncbi:Tex-like N-terminal domain-containing protein [Mycoplasma phocoenae]|uniref:S1 RNA-binding domain-containing protein n=1 Tax=Mycoplasma phocoenae TaxID=754517 RepID=A0A858U730_9MOLU|nr:Tex-like N-terminal domain-containing protein [Mycoplasma phocoenae]QJG67043.1 S1 RNA-binding domain-containing protein [Mycoplasma phocoenae]
MNKSIEFVAKQLKIKEQQVETVLKLLAEGATVPFISRYRKDATGGLDEEQVESIDKIYQYDVELNKRKDAIIEILKNNKLLTPEIEAKINNAVTKSEVENIYEPFKVGKKTKATEAIALGLEPLAISIMEANDRKFNPYEEAKKYLTEQVTTIEFAIEQAQFIISQIMSTNIEAREYVKNQINHFGKIVTKIKRGAATKDEKQAYKNYYDYSEPVKRIANHRVLAISRAEDEKIISYTFDYSKSFMKQKMNKIYYKIPSTGPIIVNSYEDALDRLILPSIEREIKSDLFARAEKSAIELFAANLEEMLLAPAVKNKTILAIDPAFANGCKIAIISPTGEFLYKAKMFPNPPQNHTEQAYSIMVQIINKFKPDIIVIGNGTASRETETFVAKVLKSHPSFKHIKYAIVSEVGASVYSASKIAIDEFPELSVEERSAINIGRKFQDPLNELVKIDPKSIGVGQYQHDLNQKELMQALGFKVNKVVNQVGVDVNTATKEILAYISGLSAKIASNIVEYRNEIGKFRNRNQIKKVKGLGAKTFEQAIGFLRIHNSENFFDRTQIHPESYDKAEALIKQLNINLENIDIDLLNKADKNELAKKLNSNQYEIELIIDSLTNPTKDIRDSKDGLILRDDILDKDELKIGMQLPGTVENITDFGAFVYIGIKEAALIHISKMGEKYIKHPSEVLSVGQKINIEIINIDTARNRIAAKLITKK